MKAENNKSTKYWENGSHHQNMYTVCMGMMNEKSYVSSEKYGANATHKVAC